MNVLEQKIFDKIVQRTDIDASTLSGFTENTPLFGKDAAGGLSMNLDSVDALELNVLLYDEWGIELDITDMAQFKTIKIIADYVRPYEEKLHG
jgi:acyl carrier protein